MGTWNYRVIYHEGEDNAPLGAYYGLHEVFYDIGGRPTMWAEKADLVGDSEADLTRQLVTMLLDVHLRPMLYANELEAQIGRYWRNPWRRFREWWDRKTTVPFNGVLEDCKKQKGTG